MKDCGNCKYFGVRPDELPCDLCFDQIAWQPKTDAFDEINKPAHYADRKIEVIEFIKDCGRYGKYAGNEIYFVGNVIKYITRFRLKGTPLKDLKKAKYYIEALIQEAEINGAE